MNFRSFLPVFPKRKYVILNVMRIAILLFFGTTFGFSPLTGLSQEVIHFKSTQVLTVDAIFEEIEAQTPYHFIYRSDLFKDTPDVRVRKGKINIEELLEKSLADLPISFEVNGTDILLLRLPAVASRSIVEQNQIITGTVTDENGVPLPGVNVTVEGTNEGTTTDFDGRYVIEIKKGQTLRFISVGYREQSVVISEEVEIDIVLQEGDLLDEVIVVGYGSVKKSDLTGAVSSVKAEEFNKGNNVSLGQALEGRVPGVQIDQKSNEPGGGLSIKIRGSGSINAGNDPLYVVDGLILNNGTVAGTGGAGFTGNNNPRNPLNSLNPADIESIEVLKDASSTAIYGARGSNGVVLITTKKGKEGKLKINLNAHYGIQKAQNVLGLLSPTQYKDVLNSIIDDGGGDPQQRIENIQGNGTNWLSQVLRNSAPTQNYDLTFSGASKDINYYSSINYFNQEGLVKNSGLDRYSLRLNLNSNSDDRYEYGINLNGTFIKNKYAPTGSGINENGGALYSAINMDPTLLPFDENGNYTYSEFITIDNPNAILDGLGADDDSFRFFGDTFFKYYVMPSLSAKVQVGGDMQQVRRSTFVEPYTLNGRGTGGIASIQTGRKDYLSLQGVLNYDKEFNEDHYLNVVVGSTYEFFQTKTFNGNSRGFALPDLKTSAIGSGDPELNRLGSGQSNSKFISYFGRVNYTLNNKYLFTASLRADGSSRFGIGNKFGYFPSGAVAWKITEESFMENALWLDQLKLRLSVGTTGNANIGNSLTIRSFSVGDDVLFGSSFYSTIEPSRLENPDLSWESALQYDVGLDFSLFNGRLNGTIDYFHKKTTDLLLNVPQALNTGFNIQVQNLGSVQNQGFEFSLNAEAIRTGNFSWEISGNLATLKNKVLDIGGQGDILRGNQSQIPDYAIVRPGYAIDSYYGFIVDGVWQTGEDFSSTEPGVAPGDFKYRDINGDGKIDGQDRVIIGNAIPDFAWGFTNDFRYKGFSFSVVLKGVEGVKRLNGNLLNTYYPNNFRRNRISKPLLNRWTSDNPTNEYPSFVNPTSQGGANAVINSRTVEDASFIRLQSIRLGYNIPVVNSKAFNKFSIYLTGQNLATITGYSGVDPAANAGGSDTAALDFNAYPVPRTFLIGFNVEF